MWASLKGRLDVVSALLKHDNVHVNLKNIAGSTALDVARNCEWTDIVSLLEQRHDANLPSHPLDVKSRKRRRR